MPARQREKADMDRTDRYVTTGEASRIVPLSVQTITTMFDEGMIEGFRVPSKREGDGRHRRIRLSSLKEFAKKNGIPFGKGS